MSEVTTNNGTNNDNEKPTYRDVLLNENRIMGSDASLTKVL